MLKIKLWFKYNWKNFLLIVDVFAIVFGLSFTAFSLRDKKNKEVFAQAGVEQTWQREEFDFSYDDDLDKYDCFLLEEKEHIYVERENVYLIYTDADFNEYFLVYQKIAKEGGIPFSYFLKEEYRLYFYIGVCK